MLGKLSTCDCVLEIDAQADTYQFLFICEHHFKMGYNAEEVAREHQAQQHYKARFNPIAKIRRYWNS